MKFVNWAEFVVLDGQNNALGQGNSPIDAVENALSRGNTVAKVNTCVVHQTVARADVCIDIRFCDNKGLNISFKRKRRN